MTPGGAVNLLQRIVSATREESRFTLSDYLSSFAYGGVTYPLVGTTASSDRETTEASFTGYIQGVYKSSGVVFACMVARMLVFSEARFQWQRLRHGRPGDLFGTTDLTILERPWPNGTTGELLARMLQDADLAGNAYVVREAGRLRRLRPDWVHIVLSAPPDQAVASDVVGYEYRPGGNLDAAVYYLPGELAHWSPLPDPEAQYRGMSWVTPVLREIEADKAATRHKGKFFDNAATPNLAVSVKEPMTEKQFREFIKANDERSVGIDKAYRTMYVGGGADVKVVGADLQQLDFKSTQGAGETRIAAAARVHPVIVGLSEGLQGSSLNAGNFNAARRMFADGALRPLWRSVSAALSVLVPPPDDARLWYDERDVGFLREDSKDIADTQQVRAVMIRQLIDAGFLPDSVVAAVENEDFTMLVHSGLYSVQLQPAGTAPVTAPQQQPPIAASAQRLALPAAPRHLTGQHDQKTHSGGGGAKLYDSDAEAKEFLDGHYGDWRSGLSDAEDKGLRFYQSPGFALMNGQLRGLGKDNIKADVSFNDADLARARKSSTGLKKAIAKAPPLTEPVLVHRGFSADQFGSLKEGMSIRDKGFVSTSLTSKGISAVGKASSPAVAVITLPKGTKAGAGSSREMILPPNSKFKVNGVQVKNGVTYVDLELEL